MSSEADDIEDPPPIDYEGDPLLASLVRDVNTRETEDGLSITLTVGGAIVSGKLGETWPTPTKKMSKSTPQHAPGVIRMLDNADVIRPFELPDVVGNDVSLAIPRGLYLEFRQPGFAPAPPLEHLVTAGYLGRKTRPRLPRPQLSCVSPGRTRCPRGRSSR